MRKLWLATVLVLATSSGVGAAGLPLGSRETVLARAAGANDHAWTAAYDAEVVNGALVLRVSIHLIPAGVTRPELGRVQPIWEEAIRRIWSGRFAVELQTGERYPVLVEPSFIGPDFHHEVVVRPGQGWTDQLDWHLGDSPETVAHEFGHMLGAFDDYAGGATAAAGPELDAGSVMTSRPGPGVKARSRHMEGARTWFSARSGAQARLLELEERETRRGWR